MCTYDICALHTGTCYDYCLQKIMILCNDVNKTSTSIELLAINILNYTSKRSTVGLGIKSMAGLKTFVEE